MSILFAQEVQKLIQTWSSIDIDYIDARPLMLQDIDREYKRGLAKYATPAMQLKGDIGDMNGVERLADGTIPLLIWLNHAVEMSGGRQEAKDFIELIGVVQARTTGAPAIDVVGLPEIKEEIIHQDDMVSSFFMTEGLRSSDSVSRLAVKRFDAGQVHHTGQNETLYLGTGFLVAPTLLVTNHHVINARNSDEARASEDDLRLQAASTVARFGFDDVRQTGNECPVSDLCAWNDALDYAVVRLAVNPGIRWLNPSLHQPIEHKKGDRMPVNIIQHPEGGAKKYAIRNNLVSGSTDTDLRYFTDTKAGSSGSPVFDDRWRLVAIHRGATAVSNVKYQGRSTAYLNVGTKWGCVLADIEKHFAKLWEEISSAN